MGLSLFIFFLFNFFPVRQHTFFLFAFPTHTVLFLPHTLFLYHRLIWVLPTVMFACHVLRDLSRRAARCLLDLCANLWRSCPWIWSRRPPSNNILNEQIRKKKQEALKAWVRALTFLRPICASLHLGG